MKGINWGALLLIFGFAAALGAGPAPMDGYLLRPGDLLLVSVWKEADLQSEVLIRPDGGMSCPARRRGLGPGQRCRVSVHAPGLLGREIHE